MVEHHLVKVSDEGSTPFFPAHEKTRVVHFTPLEEKFMGQNTAISSSLGGMVYTVGSKSTFCRFDPDRGQRKERSDESKHGPVVELVDTPDLGSGVCRFKSGRGYLRGVIKYVGSNE